MRIVRHLFLFGFPLLLASIALFFRTGEEAIALTPQEQISQANGLCEDRAQQMVREEVEVYRRVQYAAEDEWSVLGAATTKSSDLVPYLVLNYHALSCRLRSICDAVTLSHGNVGGEATTVMAHRPIGCSRLFSARGRWWSDEHRNESVDPPIIAECNYRAMQREVPSFEITPDYYTVGTECRAWVEQILQEERQMLRLLVAQDSAERGTRQVVSIFQAVLQDIRSNFLEPLRSMVDLFGSIIHPIPCLLTQCN